MIVAHLGSGASMCGLRDGRSVESTMGFTALDGLPMGTRPGQLDPGVVLYLIEQQGMTAAEVTDLLYKRLGLKGLSGISNDMRDLLASDDPARDPRDRPLRPPLRAPRRALAAALGGSTPSSSPPASARTRRRSARASPSGCLARRRARPGRERRPAPPHFHSRSRVALLVVPTDEELMIARHTLALIGAFTDRRDRMTLPP